MSDKNCPDCMIDENAIGQGKRCAQHEIEHLQSRLAALEAENKMLKKRDEIDGRVMRRQAEVTISDLDEIKRLNNLLSESKDQLMLLTKMLESKNPEGLDNLAKALGSPEAEEIRYWSDKAESAETRALDSEARVEVVRQVAIEYLSDIVSIAKPGSFEKRKAQAGIAALSGSPREETNETK